VPLIDLEMVKTSKRLIQEWASLFKGFLASKDEQQDPPVNSLCQMGFNTVVTLKTPSKREGSFGIMDRFPYYTPEGIRSLLISQDKEDEDWEDLVSNKGLPKDVVDLLKAIKEFMLDFENWWKQPVLDSTAILSSVQEDLYTLKQTCESISLMLGKPVEIGNMNFPDAWTAIGYAANYLSSSTEWDSVTARLAQFQDMWDALQLIQADMLRVNQTIKSLINASLLFNHYFSAFKTCRPPLALCSKVDQLYRSSVTTPLLRSFRSPHLALPILTLRYV
jgi:hypothetical protein